MASKRQTTMAKMMREQALREKRQLKAEKKQAAAAARNLPPAEPTLAEDGLEDGLEDVLEDGTQAA
jgi:hypothetical protein